MPSCEKCHSTTSSSYTFYYGTRRNGSGNVKYRDTICGSMRVFLCNHCISKHRFSSFAFALVYLAGGLALCYLSTKIGEWTGAFNSSSQDGLLSLVAIIPFLIGVPLAINGLISLPALIYRRSTLGAKLGYKINAEALKLQGYNVHWTESPNR